MKRGYGIIGGVLIAAALSVPALAHAKGKGEPQPGGLPGLEDRVEADEAKITTLQSDVTTLQGQNNWAVVSAAGAVARSFCFSCTLPVTVEKLATGQYDVIFTGKDVSGCAYEATIGDTAKATPTQGQISVSGGDTTDEVFVQTFTVAGTVAADSPFHLYVSCPK